MAELERLEANPFSLTLDEKARCMANHMEAFTGQCTEEFRIGFFFDGTNNNKDRDAPKQAHSNVARLFDLFEEKDDQIKVYIPGIGTPFPKEIGDTGRGYDARAGLMAGWGGEARINWALLQVTDALYRRYYGDNVSKAMGSADLATVRKISADLSFPVHKRAAAARDEAQKVRDEAEELNDTSTVRTLGGAADTADNFPNDIARKQELKRRREFVSQKLKQLIADRKPKLLRIRLSVFGFSRGAAEARVFSNWLKDALDDDMTLAGVPVSFDFLGILDTVASVGFAQSSMFSTGHGGWGQEEFLRIPKYVKRTVHLVSAHEIRGSFPLDKAVANNCLELAYPGVHTDVGGAYQPGDQGRGCRADGAPDDSTKVSQVTLAKMYREAVAAGVPLNPAAATLPQRAKEALKISPQLIKDYNAYVDAVNPLIRKKGGGTTGAAHVQYGLYLRWRRLRLGSGADTFENQPFFKRAQNFSLQCAQDLSGANEELRDEAKTMAEMENSIAYSDGWMTTVLRNTGLPAAALLKIQRSIWGEKVAQWREVKQYWNDTSPLDPRVVKFFDDYVHDSRAWFKPMGATNEGVWKLRQKARLEELKRKDAQWKANWGAEWQKLNADIQRDPQGTLERYAPLSEGGKGEVAPPPPPVMGQDRIDLDRYLKDGSLPLEKTGREFSSVWGYLRWRTHYAPESTLGERAEAAWNKVTAATDKVVQKGKTAAHDAEESLARTARKLHEAGQDSLEHAAKNTLQRFLGGDVRPL
ncbi:T6SS phospholipase effector Tle1-like catalytic domain-containing protein [Ralstonia sp. R-29]|uniref:T6SS phospholipase effector Tle1-like catalytic domain-containing protein n=1 Tax=Ralstonia sp. R-29 TaxID=3404059 RepID=UPI003CE9945F